MHLDPIASVLLWATFIFFMGMIGRYLAQSCHQSGVLGELLMGVFIGNLGFWMHSSQIMLFREGNLIEDVHHLISILNQTDGLDRIRVAYALDVFSRYGVIFLLFMVGLECSVEEIKQTGKEAFRVATIGVIAPMCLGIILMKCILPGLSFHADLFVGATLTATSVGITARVLKELKKTKTREAKTILGAAVIDDVLGLMMLAVVSGIVISGSIHWGLLLKSIISVIIFFIAMLSLGPILIRGLIQKLSFLDVWEQKLVVAFICSMGFSWLATSIQLASIIGAFAAGLIIQDDWFDSKTKKNQPSLQSLIAPFELLLAPLFFMLIGMQVKLELLLNWHILGLTCGLLLVAVIGKLFSGFGARKKDDRFLIGIGMLPRGEVGLVFASIGRGLGVISDELFSSIVLMVIITTVMTPPWLKYRFSRHD